MKKKKGNLVVLKMCLQKPNVLIDSGFNVRAVDFNRDTGSLADGVLL